MAHSYGKLHYHVIFSTKMRRPVIAESWRKNLHAYMHGIVESHGGRLHRVGGPPSYSSYRSYLSSPRPSRS